MTRTEGSRNQSYEARRQAILMRARARLAQPGIGRASFRELAEACGVSVPTLRHYFARRDDLVLAVMAEDFADGAAHLAHVASPQGAFADSVREVVGYLAFGFSHGLGDIHTLGLSEGLGHVDIGPAFVDLVLEPSLIAVQRRLDAHVATGEMCGTETRHASLSLLSPVVLLLLHQQELGGAERNKVEIERFLDDHAAAFVRAYRA